VLAKDPDRDLPLGHRQAVAAALPDSASRLRLELGALRALLALDPRARERPQGTHAAEKIAMIERLLVGDRTAPRDLHRAVGEGVALCNASGGDLLLTSLAFGATAAASSALPPVPASPERRTRRRTEAADAAARGPSSPARAGVETRAAAWRRKDDDDGEHLEVDLHMAWDWADERGVLGRSHGTSAPGEAVSWGTSRVLWAIDEPAAVAKAIAQLPSIERVVARGDHAYFWSEGALFAADRSAGGAPARLVADAALVEKPHALSVDATSLYWIGPSGVHSVDKDGGEVHTLVQQGDPRSIALGPEHVYVCLLDDAPPLGSGIVQIPKRGGPAKSLLRARTRHLRARGAGLFWVDTQRTKQSLWTAHPGARTAKAVKLLERPSILNHGVRCWMDLLVTDREVLVTDCAPGGRILRVTGSSKSTPIAKLGVSPELLGIMGDHLYCRTGDTLVRITIPCL
jgi:hypothetical protein